MLRAVYEGIVFSHTTHVRRLLANRPRPEAIRLAGGAANSEVWVQMFADMLQIPIETVKCDEQGILGAAMAAGVGCGVFESYGAAAAGLVQIGSRVMPREAYAQVYEKKYGAYRAVVESLNPVWSVLD